MSSKEQPTTVISERNYSVPEAAKQIGISVRQTWELVSQRKLSCFRIGRRVLISREHIAQYLQSVEVLAVNVKANAAKALHP